MLPMRTPNCWHLCKPCKWPRRFRPAVRISSQLNQSDARNVNATLAFEARRDALPAVEKAFKDAGVDFLSRNIVRSTDTAGTLDTKIRFRIEGGMVSADSLEPRALFHRAFG